MGCCLPCTGTCNELHVPEVVTQGSLDLSPWLYVLPAELAPFRGLLKKVRNCSGSHSVLCQAFLGHTEVTRLLSIGVIVLTVQLGVAESFSSSQFTALLAGMHKEFCASPGDSATPRALPASQLAQAIAAVQALADTRFNLLSTPGKYLPNCK